jgi:amidophosphoribosyltransferase
MACFDGQYPIELPAGNLIGKHLLEGFGKRATMPDATPDEATAAVAELEAEYDTREYSDALHRP